MVPLNSPTVELPPSAMPSAVPRQESRDFAQLRVRSYPPGHARIGIEHGCGEHPLLLIWLRGGGLIRQHGRAVAAGAGSLCFLRGDAPVLLCDLGPGGAVALELPPEVEARSRAQVAAAVGGVITAETGAAALLRGFLDALDHQPPSYRPEYPGWVQSCVCEITERVLGECVGFRPSPAERAVLAARNYVLTHLTDPDLSPHRVARAAAVSLRTLNRLFAAEGDSVGGCIRHHRLERCRTDLLDPGKADRTISQIGTLWGFPDAAHFSRIFKETYGCSPRAYRAGAARPGTARHDVA